MNDPRIEDALVDALVIDAMQRELDGTDADTSKGVVIRFGVGEGESVRATMRRHYLALTPQLSDLRPSVGGAD